MTGTLEDCEALDQIAAKHLGEMDYDNSSSALESISMLVAATGREVQGWDE